MSKHRGKVIALLFYPKNETLVCTKQMCSVRDNWAKYIETKAEIVAVSPGTIRGHLRFGRKYKIPIKLLADDDRAVTKTYSKYHWLIPVSFTRAIVIVDAKGYIRSKQVMIRPFRPTDKSVIDSIYAATADAAYEKYKLMKKNVKTE